MSKNKGTAVAAPGTPEMPLKGEKSGTTKALDGKTVLRSKPDPLVVERAKEHVANIEAIVRAKGKANESGEALRQAFKKSKRARTCKVNGELGSYLLEATDFYKLIVKKDKTVN